MKSRGERRLEKNLASGLVGFVELDSLRDLVKSESGVDRGREDFLQQGLSFQHVLDVLEEGHGSEDVCEQERLNVLALTNQSDDVDIGSRLLRQKTVQDEARSEAHVLEHISSDVASDALEAHGGSQLLAGLTKRLFVAIEARVHDVLASEVFSQHLGLDFSSDRDNWSNSVLLAKSDDHTADLRCASGQNNRSRTKFFGSLDHAEGSQGVHEVGGAFLQRGIIRQGHHLLNVRNGVLGEGTTDLVAANFVCFHESDAFVKEPLRSLSASDFDHGASAFPTRGVRVGKLDIVHTLHEVDVTGVESTAVHLDEELVGAGLGLSNLAEGNSGVRGNQHRVHLFLSGNHIEK